MSEMKPDRIFSEVDTDPIVKGLTSLCRELVERVEQLEFQVAKLDGLVAGLGSAFIGDGVAGNDASAHAKITGRLRVVQEFVEFHNEANPDRIVDLSQNADRSNQWTHYLLDRWAALERGEEREERLPS